MPKMSAKERAELEAKLAEDDEASDYDPEITVGHQDGTYDRMPYSLARHHYPDRYKDPDPPKADKGDSAAQSDDGKNVKRFTAGRRTG